MVFQKRSTSFTTVDVYNLSSNARRKKGGQEIDEFQKPAKAGPLGRNLEFFMCGVIALYSLQPVTAGNSSLLYELL
jgi:hypothetical protein